MSQIQEKEEILVREFSALTSWDDRYKKIIEWGKKLPPFPENHRTEENKVKGCQSQVWLFAQLTPDKKVQFVADSDALIVKGLIALLVFVYSNASPEEILAQSPQFISRLGFDSNLSPSRTNGLFSMVKQIKIYATAFDYLLKNKK